MDENQIALVLAELSHLSVEQQAFVGQALRSGVDPANVFVQRTFALAPSAFEKHASKRSLYDYRPVYSVGAFPTQPSVGGPGSRAITLKTLAQKAARRQGYRDRYGDEAVLALPELAEPVI